MPDLAPGCLKCKLYEGCKSPVMPPDLTGMTNGVCDIMFVGEAPGETEDNTNTPFVGKAGQFLREAVEAAGLNNYNIIYTNAVRCRPPNNSTPTARQITYCQHFIIDEIEKHNPAIVMLLGNVPLKSVLGEVGITHWRGTILERNGRRYAPAWHPSYVLREAAHATELFRDFDAVADAISGAAVHDVSKGYERYLISTAAEVEEMHQIIMSVGKCSMDTESNLGIHPYQPGCHPIMMSFAVSGPGLQRAWAVTNLSDPEVVESLLSLIQDESIQKVYHNAKYDALVCYAEYGIWPANVVGDSALASYLLDSAPGGHGLKELAGRYLGMYEYDQKLQEYHAQHPESDPKRHGDNSLVPVDLLADYASLDAVATLELENLLYHELGDGEANNTLAVLYEQLMLPANMQLAKLESAGLVVDADIDRRYVKVYNECRAQQYQQIMQDPYVKKYIKHMQTELDADYHSKKHKKAAPAFHLNPGSYEQMRTIIYGSGYYHLEPLAFTPTGKPSLSWDVLKEYAGQHPFLKLYRYYILLTKMLSTYLEPALDWRGRDYHVHMSISTINTVTGRTASSDPMNSQNIPTPEKEPGTLLATLPIKNIFTHTWWGSTDRVHWPSDNSDILAGKSGCVLAADYSGMELRVMASVSQCRGMIDIFESGADVHSVVTCKLYGYELADFVRRRKAGDEAAISARYHAKWVNWTLLYGGSAYTLHQLYGIPMPEAERLVNTYYTMFPEVLQYRGETIDFARRNGYVESPFGRRRYMPYINDSNDSKRHAAEREAINMPIQSAASDVLLCALIIISDQITGRQSRLMNTVHDSLMGDIYPGELPVMAHTMRDVMEGVPTKYAKRYFPGLDFSWLTVPLVADLEFGHFYGSLTDYHEGA